MDKSQKWCLPKGRGFDIDILSKTFLQKRGSIMIVLKEIIRYTKEDGI